MKTKTWFALALTAAIAQVSSSFASEIDLRGLPGNHDQLSLGQPNSTFYAQSVYE